MFNETTQRYAGGLDMDTSKYAFSPLKYSYLRNFRLLTIEGLSNTDISIEPGTKLNLEFSNTLYKIWEIGIIADGVNVPCVISINNVPIPISSTTLDYIYYGLLNSSVVQGFITSGLLKVFKTIDTVVIAGLDSALEVQTSGNISAVCITEAQTSMEPIGVIVIRDWVVIFTKSTTAEPHMPALYKAFQIWKFQTSDKGYTISNTVNNKLVPSKHLVYNKTDLAFPNDIKVHGIGNYESPEIIKVYFTDTINPLRHINIADTDTLAYDVTKLSILSDINFSPISITSIQGGGSYKAGVVQYAYLLFNKHGNTTCYSPVSTFVNISESSESGYSYKFRGSAKDAETSKSVSMRITDLDTRFQYIRVVAVYYDTYDGTPAINIVKESAVPSSGILEFTDFGNSMGTVTMSEFSLLGTVNPVFKDITPKSNILFGANVKESFYDIGSWDSRAYRFVTGYGIAFAKIKSSDGTTNYVNQAFQLLDNSYQVINDIVYEEHDCIQTKSMQCEEAYLRNINGKMGGSGPNVSYEFDLSPVIIDSFGISNTANNALLGIDIGTTPTNGIKPSYGQETIGYQRGEVYRFGIRFINNLGQKSFVKWIGDIAMPQMYMYDAAKLTYSNKHDFATFYVDGNNTVANHLGIKFTVSNFPTDAVAFQIVRCERTDTDKTIVAQGFWQKTYYNSGSTVKAYVPCDMSEFRDGSYSGSHQAYKGYTFNNFVGCLVSPEVNMYNKPEFKGGDYVEILAIMQGSNTGSTAISTMEEYYGAERNIADVYKVRNLRFPQGTALPPCPNLSFKMPVEDSKFMDQGWSASGSLLPSISLRNYIFGNDNDDPLFYHTSSLFFKINNPTTPQGWDSNLRGDYHLMNYCRDVVPYGGNSYQERAIREYIPCTQIIPILNTTAPVVTTVFGGDTIIRFFDNQIQLHDKDSYLYTGSIEAQCVVFYFPVETTINLDYRHDYSFSKLAGNTQRCKLQQTAGDYDDFAQAYDLYLYNKVYSKASNLQIGVAEPFLFSDNTEFDCKIQASLTKMSNELTDSWLVFLPENMIVVENQFGPINALINFDQYLLFMQDRGFGAVSINERILTIPDDTGTSLTLGKGGILDDVRYISKRSGCMNWESVVVSGVAHDTMYYLDSVNKEIMIYTVDKQRLSGNMNIPLSSLKGVYSELQRLSELGYLTDTDSLSGYGTSVVKYPKFKRILFNFFNKDADTPIITLAYNELLQTFEGFYDYGSKMFFISNDALYGLNPTAQELHTYGNGINGHFFNQYYNSEIQLVLNALPDDSKAFNNIAYNLTCKDVDGNDLPSQNFADLRIFNDYQDSGIVPLVYGQNARRRMRVWRAALPRNYGTTERIKSQTAVLQLRFQNKDDVTAVLEPLTWFSAERNF